jgi:hypothetical protein
MVRCLLNSCFFIFGHYCIRRSQISLLRPFLTYSEDSYLRSPSILGTPPHPFLLCQMQLLNSVWFFQGITWLRWRRQVRGRWVHSRCPSYRSYSRTVTSNILSSLVSCDPVTNEIYFLKSFTWWQCGDIQFGVCMVVDHATMLWSRGAGDSDYGAVRGAQISHWLVVSFFAGSECIAFSFAFIWMWQSGCAPHRYTKIPCYNLLKWNTCYICCSEIQWTVWNFNVISLLYEEENIGIIVDGPYNENLIVITSEVRGVYDKFHAHFGY